jgi:hypothetical protein
VTFVAEGTCTYTLKDGTVLNPIPLASVIDLNSSHLDKIQHYHAFLDISPLMAVLQAAANN